MKTPSPVASLTYEQALAELEAIVLNMEDAEQPLETAIAMFERGQALANHCAALLENATLRVRQLTANGETIEMPGSPE